MNPWDLPISVNINGTIYGINADFRDILEIIEKLTDERFPAFFRLRVALELFYTETVTDRDVVEAAKYMADFIAYGERSTRPLPKLIDWKQDAQLIVSDVNKVAGREIRSEGFTHWWTFLSYFYGIGDGQLAQIVNIRSKKVKKKKLEKWEQEFYNENREKVDFHIMDATEESIHDFFKT